MSNNKEEEKYFQQREMERREQLRREKELVALQQEERQNIASNLNTSDEIAAEALALGFDAETARVLPLMPLIQVAWADGSVSGAEERSVTELAESRGIEEGSAAHQFLKRLLLECPSDLFFERVNRVLMNMVASDPDSWVKKSIPELCREVAEASGGFLGVFGSKISEEEQNLIDDLVAQFDVSSASGKDLNVFTGE